MLLLVLGAISIINFSPAAAICKLPFDVTKADANLQIYKEANCKIALAEWHDSKRYPVTWNCDHLKTTGPPLDLKCTYRGKTYQYREEIKAEDMDKSDICLTGCRCNGPLIFQCVPIECPSFFTPPPPPPCYYVHEEGKCCPSVRCPKPGEEVHKCEHEGRTILDGNQFEKGDKICTCSKELDGTPESEAKYCKEKTFSCHVELLYLSRVAGSYCAPVFWDSINSCPIEWRCYDAAQDHVVTVGSATPSQPQIEQCPPLTCKYGPLEVPIGSTLNTRETESNVTCTCYVPPMVTCTKVAPEHQ